MAGELTPKQYAKKLREFDGALPAVYAATMTRLAVAGEGAQRRQLGKEFTIRNKWTTGSIKTWKAKPQKNAEKINAVTGTLSPYLLTQEVGGTEVGKDGKPTKTTPSAASRGKNWSRPIMARFRWKAVKAAGDAVFILKPRSGNAVVSRKRQGLTRTGRPSKRGGRCVLTETIMVKRQGRKLIRVRVINKGPVHLKPRHWHADAMKPLLKPTLIEAAFVDEAKKSLAKL